MCTHTYMHTYILCRKRKAFHQQPNTKYIYTHARLYIYVYVYVCLVSRILKITHSSKVRVVSVVFFSRPIPFCCLSTKYRNALESCQMRSLQSRNSCLLEHTTVESKFWTRGSSQAEIRNRNRNRNRNCS